MTTKRKVSQQGSDSYPWGFEHVNHSEKGEQFPEYQYLSDFQNKFDELSLLFPYLSS
jgi:hypothetical protein